MSTAWHGSTDPLDEPVWMLVGSTAIWGEAEARYRPGTKAVCPACRNQRLPEGAACLICSASWRDHRRRPMQTDLAGGTGPSPRVAKGKAGAKATRTKGRS